MPAWAVFTYMYWPSSSNVVILITHAVDVHGFVMTKLRQNDLLKEIYKAYDIIKLAS